MEIRKQIVLLRLLSNLCSTLYFEPSFSPHILQSQHSALTFSVCLFMLWQRKLMKRTAPSDDDMLRAWAGGVAAVQVRGR